MLRDINTNGSLRPGRIAGARRQLIQANRNRLAQVHRRLPGSSGNLDQQVAIGEIFARQPALLRAKDQGHASAAGYFLLDERSERGQRNHRLLGLAMRERSGADHERAIGHSLRQATPRSWRFGAALRRSTADFASRQCSS